MGRGGLRAIRGIESDNGAFRTRGQRPKIGEAVGNINGNWTNSSTVVRTMSHSMRAEPTGIELALFSSRIEAVCEEMGAILQRAAFSPNIRDRLDFSCAVFDAEGELAAQAAHIPVHLGSMAFAMKQVVASLDWAPGDMVIFNDPFLGGTHLPDVTVIAPVFSGKRCLGFVANRAHHADIGASDPGSMPVSRSLTEEGLLITPSHLMRRGRFNRELMGRIVAATGNPLQSEGDFTAQMSANRVGVQRIQALVEVMGADAFEQGLTALNDYAQRLASTAIEDIPDGTYTFQDVLDDDGQGHFDLPIAVSLRIRAGQVDVDFAGTAPQVAGNVNCPLSVTAAAVFYVFRCLMPPHTPGCAGSFRPIRLHAPSETVVNAVRPAAVAAGNVETSSRIVDAVMGALAKALPQHIAAASQGTMNNVAMGGRGRMAWDYYETIGGGMGAGPRGGGLSGVQTHMTNTLNTPIEVLEANLPLRVRRYALRRGSGGAGRRPGGDGLIREYEFLAPATVNLLTERRCHAPWGLAGGGPGQPGENRLDGERLSGKTRLTVRAGQRLVIATPGGGAWGRP